MYSFQIFQPTHSVFVRGLTSLGVSHDQPYYIYFMFLTKRYCIGNLRYSYVDYFLICLPLFNKVSNADQMISHANIAGHICRCWYVLSPSLVMLEINDFTIKSYLHISTQPGISFRASLPGYLEFLPSNLAVSKTLPLLPWSYRPGLGKFMITKNWIYLIYFYCFELNHFSGYCNRIDTIKVYAFFDLVLGNTHNFVEMHVGTYLFLV